MQLDLPKRIRRKPSLTPMIDVVFLLLVFFMLASRFGVDAALPLPLAGGGGEYSGPPRLVDISPAELKLNGQVVTEDQLAENLLTMVEKPTDTIVIRAQDGAILQRVIGITELLQDAGFTSVVLLE